MRVIIKPLGVAVLLSVMASLAVLPRLFPLKPITRSATAAPRVASSPEQVPLKASLWEAYSDPGASLARRPLQADRPDLKDPVRFDIFEPGPHPWSIGYHIQVPTAQIPSGKAQLKFLARSTAEREITVMTQATVAPYTTDSQQPIALTTQWKEYTVDLRVDKHPEKVFFLTFQFGQAKNAVELASIRLLRK
ncbi:MAG: hypothetical protein SFU56_13570 [Capsulimonadales bacterium]|nr:hypothetical protein [Capsulimonadales bacterium]